MSIPLLPGPSAQPSTEKPWLTRLLRGIGAASLTILVTVVVIGVAKISGLYAVMTKLSGYFMSSFGIDSAYAWPVALALTIPTLTVLWWVLGYLFLGRRKWEVTALGFAAAIAVMAAMHFLGGDVYFDRTTGEPAKCYAKTSAGFRFSSTCDYDPTFGIRYLPVTPEIVKEIRLWEKTGSLGDVPDVELGKFFDQLTNEPIVWYSVREGGYKFFALPGYDPMTGEKLRPVTPEIAQNYAPDQDDTKKSRLKKDIRAILHNLDRRDEADPKRHKFPKELTDTEWNAYHKARDELWEWYRSTPSALATQSSDGMFGPEYRFRVEKLVFLDGYAFIGIRYTASVSTMAGINGTVLDADRRAHEPEFVFIEGRAYRKPATSFVRELRPGESIEVVHVLDGVHPLGLTNGMYSAIFDESIFFGFSSRRHTSLVIFSWHDGGSTDPMSLQQESSGIPRPEDDSEEIRPGNSSRSKRENRETAGVSGTQLRQPAAEPGAIPPQSWVQSKREGDLVETEQGRYAAELLRQELKDLNRERRPEAKKGATSISKVQKRMAEEKKPEIVFIDHNEPPQGPRVTVINMRGADPP